MIIDTPFLKIKARPLFAGFMMFFASAFGQTYFISIFAGEIRSDFNLSLGEWGLLYSAGTLGSAILMLLAGGLVDRHSVISSTRWVFFAMLFTILFMIINPVFWLLPLIILGLRFCGQGMLHHIPVVFIGREFGLHRGKSISFASMGMSVSEALLPIIFVSIMGFLGWRTSWAIVFFLGIVFCRLKDIDIRIVFIRSTTFFSVNEDFCVIVSHFVDPRTGEHTNGIENCWSLMKKNLSRFYPIKNDEWLLIYLYSYQ